MDVSRYTNTKELRFTIEFVTPCFLGGADGNAEVRTAPFKNLLRRWWRIARRSSRNDLSTRSLWEEEGKLFGSKEMHEKSKITLRIISENVTYEKPDGIRFGGDLFIHPEVDTNGGKVTFESYLGMGPIFGTEFQKSYIRENSNIKIALTMPNDNNTVYYIITSLTLIDMYGTIGSRSRNGWGSIKIVPENFRLLPENIIFGASENITSFFAENNGRYYPQRLGYNRTENNINGLLCWQSVEDFSDWSDAMYFLAKAYMKLRTHFSLADTRKGELNKRHLLGYPVTHHSVNLWEQNEENRLPSQLLFKVIKIQGNGNVRENRFKAQILHLPYKISLEWNENLGSQESVWKEVHSFLDTYHEDNEGMDKDLMRQYTFNNDGGTH